MKSSKIININDQILVHLRLSFLVVFILTNMVLKTALRYGVVYVGFLVANSLKVVII